MTACEDIRVHLGGYVLDGLEPDEARAVRDHLTACSACAAEAADLGAARQLLALLDDEPPALLEEAPPETPAEMRARVLADARRRRPSRRRVVAAAAVLAVAVLLGVGLADLGELGGGDAAEPSAPQTESTIVLESGEGSDARGALTLDATGAGLLVKLDLADLEPLPPRGVYEVWLREPDREEPVSIGQFQRRADGTATVTFTAAGGPDDYDGFWITAEPDARDPAHQGPTVLWADIP